MKISKKTKKQIFSIVFSVVMLMALFVGVIPEGVQANDDIIYEPLILNSTTLNASTVWGYGDSAFTMDADGGFFSSAKQSSGAFPDDGKITTSDGVPYQLTWTGSRPYAGNDSIRFVGKRSSNSSYVTSTPITMKITNYGVYDKLYILGTAGGFADNTRSLNFKVTLTYTDGTKTTATYNLYDWYRLASIVESNGVGYKVYKRLNKNGSTIDSDFGSNGGPMVQSKQIECDETKVLKDITFEIADTPSSVANEHGIYAAIYAVTGVIKNGAPDSPSISAQTVNDTSIAIEWDEVKGATSYAVDVSTSSTFQNANGDPNFVSGYSNKVVNGTSVVIEGLDAGTTYYCCVRAIGTSGEQGQSSETASVTTWYKIEYILNDGSNVEGNPTTFDKDTDTFTLLDPIREGYIFSGWTWEKGMGIGSEAQTTPKKEVVIEHGSTNNKCFIANWEKMTDVIDQMVGDITEIDQVTTENKELVSDTLDIIDKLLSEDNIGSLTEDEIAEIIEQKQQLEKLLEEIKVTEDKIDEVNSVVNGTPDADETTSENKNDIENALEIIKDLLKEENVDKLTPEEKATIEDQRAELIEKLDKIEEVEERMDAVEETVKDIPNSDEVTSEDKSEIEEGLGLIEELLSEKNIGNLTPEEKESLEKQKAALEEKLENIEAAEERMDAVEETVKELPEAGEVTSEDKGSIEDALKVIEELLSEENVGNLTPEEKETVEKQKAALEEKLENIEVAEERMDAVEETVKELPKADEVTSENKGSIEDALKVIEELLSEENVGNLTPEEKEAVEKQKAALEEKLENIEVAEERMDAVEETVKELPEAGEVTSENKGSIEDALKVIEELLSEENVGNLTEEEKAALEEQKADLEEKLDFIQTVEDMIAELQDKKDDIPVQDVITTESKDAVVELLNAIIDLQENHPNNLTEEQSAVIENLKEELQQKRDRIQEIEDSLNKIEDEFAAQPDYDDITSDNKEDIKDIIDNIDNILENDKDNLSEEEIKELEEQKKELEEKLEFIEQIENYEPVVGDFANTTEPEKNDKNGNLQNESHELIEIIPLEKTEKEHVAKGESVKVYLEVTDITETIAEEEKELIEAELEKEEVAVYLDLILFKQIGNRAPIKVPNTNGAVTITFQVPSDLINQDALVTRTYKIIRVHEGETVFIDAVFDETTGEISFETDKFSTYALIYNDVAGKVPQTGDTTATWSWMFLMLGFGLLAFAGKARSMSELKKR